MEEETASVAPSIAATSGGPTASVLEELAAYTACDVRHIAELFSCLLLKFNRSQTRCSGSRCLEPGSCQTSVRATNSTP